MGMIKFAMGICDDAGFAAATGYAFARFGEDLGDLTGGLRHVSEPDFVDAGTQP
jgi:hypothetical protein